MKKWLVPISYVVIVGVFSGLFIWGLKRQSSLETQVESILIDSKIKEDTLSTREAVAVEGIVNKTIDPWSVLQSSLKDTVVQVISLFAEYNWLEPYKTPNQGRGTGTGFFINENGDIITNAHVVNQAAAVYIQIPSQGKEQFEAEVLCFNPDRDLALLKIKQKDLERVKTKLGKISYIQLGDSDSVKRGSEVMLLGFPLGQQSLKSTVGVVSGRESIAGRQFLQIDAPSNPGNSGGPCLTSGGKVIGILTAGITEAQNVNYVIPINELKLVLKDMYDCPTRLLRKPFLGVLYHPTNSAMANYLKTETSGVYVTTVLKGSLLDKAGVEAGDVITAINGHDIDMYGDIYVPGAEDKISLSDYAAFLPLNKDVSVVLYRDGKKKNLNVNFKYVELPPIRVKYPNYEKIDYEIFGGMVIMELCRNLIPMLLPISPDLIKFENPKNQLSGALIVTNVLPNSIVFKTRVITPGSIITEVNGVEVETVEGFRNAIKESMKTGYVTLKTNQDIFAVFELSKALADEANLSTLFRYQISDFMQNLLQDYLKKHEKETGSSSAGAVA